MILDTGTGYAVVSIVLRKGGNSLEMVPDTLLGGIRVRTHDAGKHRLMLRGHDLGINRTGSEAAVVLQDVGRNGQQQGGNNRIMRRTGDSQVECEVLLVPEGRIHMGDEIIEHRSDVFDVRLIPVERAEADGLRFQQDTDLDERIEIESVNIQDIVNLVHEDGDRVVGKDRPALGEGLDDAVDLEALDGAADVCAAYADGFREFSFGGQTVAGPEGPGFQQMEDMEGDFTLLGSLA